MAQITQPHRPRSRREEPQGSSSISVWWASISPDTKKAVGIVFLFALGLLGLLSVFEMAGSIGVWMSSMMGILFGRIKIIFPLLLLLLAYVFLRPDRYSVKGMNTVGLIIVAVSFAAFWHIGIDPEVAWSTALQGGGGGIFGFAFAYPLHVTLGFWGGLIILVAIFVSALLVIFNTSLSSLSGHVSALKDIGNRFTSMFARFKREKGEGQDDTQDQAVEREGEAAQEEPVPVFSTIAVAKTPDSGTAREEELPIVKPKIIHKKIQVPMDLLNTQKYQPQSTDIGKSKLIIQRTFETFGIAVEMAEVNVGPTVTQFTFKPADGVKVASILSLHNDLALSLAAHPIRIEAPIPGKSLVGIEVPNKKTAMVTMNELLTSEEFKRRSSNLNIALGKDVSGTPRFADILRMPHLLIAGSTGSGKTVCMNSIIISLLYQNGPDELRFIMVDPKRVELPIYNDIPHLLTPVVTNVKKAVNALKWAIGEMDRRFEILSSQKKRDIATYNRDMKEKLPYIVIIIDELADIMVTCGPEVENLIVRLAQMARAVGIHLILATQRPSTDVITGLIKANIPARIAFSVPSQIDSRTILDTPGAERLVGRGDMLYVSSESSRPQRIQGVYAADEEIRRVTDYLREQGEAQYEEDVTEKIAKVGGNMGDGDDDDDELLPQAKEVVMQAKKASASLLQRRLRVGYARAARLLDLLEAQGIIGPGDGARPREILVGNLDELDMLDTSTDTGEEAEYREDEPYR